MVPHNWVCWRQPDYSWTKIKLPKNRYAGESDEFRSPLNVKISWPQWVPYWSEGTKEVCTGICCHLVDYAACVDAGRATKLPSCIMPLALRFVKMNKELMNSGQCVPAGYSSPLQLWIEQYASFLLQATIYGTHRIKRAAETPIWPLYAKERSAAAVDDCVGMHRGLLSHLRAHASMPLFWVACSMGQQQSLGILTP